MLSREIILFIVLSVGSQKKLKFTRDNPYYFSILLWIVNSFEHLIGYLKVAIFLHILLSIGDHPL